MTQETGACAENTKENGLKVKADKDFGAIEVSMIVNGTAIGFFMTVEEADKLSTALQEAISKMNSPCDSCHCGEQAQTEANDDSQAEEKTE